MKLSDQLSDIPVKMSIYTGTDIPDTLIALHTQTLLQQ